MSTIEQKSNLKKVLVGASQLFCGELAGKIIIFFYTLIIVKLLATDEAGIFFWLFALTDVLVCISMLGLRLGIIKFVATSQDASFTAGVIRNSLLITVSVSIVVGLLLYSVIMLTTSQNKDLITACLPFFACALPFEAMRRILLGATEAVKKMHYTVYLESLSVQLLRLVYFVLIFYIFEKTLAAAALAYLATAITTSCFAFAVIQKNFKVNWFGRYPGGTRKLLAFSLPLAPASLLYDASRQLDVILLGALGSPAMVTILSVAVRLCNFAESFTRAIQQSITPHIAELFENWKDSEKVKVLFRFAVKWSYAGSFQLFSALIIFAAPVMGLFNVGTTEGIVCLTIIAATHAVTSVSSIASMSISMSGNTRLVLINNMCYLSAALVFNSILIPFWGIFGASIAHAASNIILMLIRQHQLNKITAIRTYSRNELYITLFGIVFSSSCYMFFLNINVQNKFIDIILYGGIFLISYTICSLLLFTSKDEKNKLKAIFNKKNDKQN